MEKKTILIIDDDKGIGKMLVRRLKKAGFLTDVVHEGKPGIERAFSLKPDLILLDIHMPITDGYEVVRTLRENNYTGLIVACSASVSVKDSQKTIDEGCDFFISKPIDNSFEQKISTLLNTK